MALSPSKSITSGRQLAPDDGIIANTATILKMTADPKANIGAYGNKTELAEAQVWDQQVQELGDVEERLANLDAATAVWRSCAITN